MTEVHSAVTPVAKASGGITLLVVPPTAGVPLSDERSEPDGPSSGPRPPAKLVGAVLLLSAVIIGVCAQVAYIWADRQPEQYAARAEIEYRGTSWVESMEVALRSPSVAYGIAFAEGIPLEDLDKRLITSRISGTQILRVQYRSEDKAQALAVVSGVVANFVERFALTPSQSDDSILVERLDSLNDRLDSAVVAVQELDAANPTDIPSAAERLAEAEVVSILAQIDNTNQQLITEQIQDADIQEVQPRVITNAYLLEKPVLPQPIRRAVLGAVAGLVVAAGLAFLLLRRHLSVLFGR